MKGYPHSLYKKRQTLSDWVLGGVLCLFFLALGVYFWVFATANADCAEAGWRGAKITWDLKAYCVRRVDQTDQIEPLNKVMK